jgi:hypothetical protein
MNARGGGETLCVTGKYSAKQNSSPPRMDGKTQEFVEGQYLREKKLCTDKNAMRGYIYLQASKTDFDAIFCFIFA